MGTGVLKVDRVVEDEDAVSDGCGRQVSKVVTMAVKRCCLETSYDDFSEWSDRVTKADLITPGPSW